MLRPSSDQRRSEILDAVVRVIIDIGYTDMTVADVAREAGVSTGLVHYHFSSKAELIAAALRAASDDDKEFRDAILARPESSVARLEAVLCESLPDDASDGSWLLWIETWGETRRSAELRAVMAELDAHETEAIEQLLAEGAARGEFAAVDTAGVAARLTALRDGMALEYTLFHPEREVATYRAHLRSAIAYNLGLTPDRYHELAPSAEPVTVTP
jgi:AcrR family transcriptional regulator